MGRRRERLVGMKGEGYEKNEKRESVRGVRGREREVECGRGVE